MVVYRIYNSIVMLELVSETHRDLKLSLRSLEFLRIHMLLLPLRDENDFVVLRIFKVIKGQ